ncbi:glycoside hydrolase, family 19 [Deinococcus sp. HMF7604]|uniref:glycoside hydrolase family 19 protein n=1 Tax=Deinococcus betulae TaxID=2873312 RepID=UPI001CD02649|nr:glycoside hydrolase family 19 protein [Deinococcus betulae]MBZ9750745.1 glycoside hydrolase, family 19 [Deinococcus betulae]
MITPALIRSLGYAGMPASVAETWADALDAAFARFGIRTPLQQAHILAQFMHESGSLRWVKEIWGPTAQQLRYDPASGTQLSRELGNTQVGDGKRYMGRGPIQLTGRGNYRAAGAELGLPLEAQPELVERPDIGALVAARYFARRTLKGRTLLEIANDGPDDQTVFAISRGVNGLNKDGVPNHLAEREAKFRTAWAALGTRPQVLLVPKGGGDPEPWDGKPAVYGGTALSEGLIEQLRTVYPRGSGPHTYEGVRLWHRQNGEIVLERLKS